jgi:hypothetical protein
VFQLLCVNACSDSVTIIVCVNACSDSVSVIVCVNACSDSVSVIVCERMQGLHLEVIRAGVDGDGYGGEACRCISHVAPCTRHTPHVTRHTSQVTLCTCYCISECSFIALRYVHNTTETKHLQPTSFKAQNPYQNLRMHTTGSAFGSQPMIGQHC